VTACVLSESRSLIVEYDLLIEVIRCYLMHTLATMLNNNDINESQFMQLMVCILGTVSVTKVSVV